MRIGIDCRLWNETGVGRYTRNLVAELLQIDKENEYRLFVLPKDRNSVKWQIPTVNYQIREAPIRWHTIHEQLAFPKVLAYEKLDLVHFPYFSVPVFYNRPYIVTIHDLILHHFPTGQASTLPYPLYWLKLQGYKHVIKQAAHKARMIIAVSNATKQEIVDHLGVSAHKIAVIYEGVDKALRNAGSSDANFTALLANKKFFLYVGNAYPHKNLKRLIEAYKIVRKQFPKIWLVLVGRNDFFYDRLRNQTVLVEGLVFLSNVDDKELCWLYQHASALVIPSFMEGFGLPPLEAMVNNCLVLASNIPSLREICDDAAIFFDPFGVTDLSEKMKLCLSTSRHLRDLRLRGLRNIKRFSWREMAKETLKVYKSALSAY